MKHTTQEELNKMSDRDIQENYHDSVVTANDCLNGSLWPSEECDIFEKELKKRKLKKLPWLNGTID